MLSVSQASGAGPLTICASAITCPSRTPLSVSCTNRAPFIDSITARTRPTRQARGHAAQAVGAPRTAVSATSSPRASTNEISS
jgi:hypothetical protein